jgi:hypothetical protein
MKSIFFNILCRFSCLCTVIFLYHGINPHPVKFPAPKQAVICKAFSLITVPPHGYLECAWMNHRMGTYSNSSSSEHFSDVHTAWKKVTWDITHLNCFVVFFYKCVYCGHWKPNVMPGQPTCVSICVYIFAKISISNDFHYFCPYFTLCHEINLVYTIDYIFPAYS